MTYVDGAGSLCETKSYTFALTHNETAAIIASLLNLEELLDDGKDAIATDEEFMGSLRSSIQTMEKQLKEQNPKYTPLYKQEK